MNKNSRIIWHMGEKAPLPFENSDIDINIDVI